MDEYHLEYSDHARGHLAYFGLTEDDVEAIVWYPARRYVTHRGVEHVGWSYDGRPFRVVTNRDERIVITIVSLERRPRKRRNKR